MYDTFSQAYDRFVNWPSRLAYEMPLIKATLSRLELPAGRTGRVLDTACGTGWHAITLAQNGWQVVGTDYSAGMVEQAQRNALIAQVEVQFLQAAFGELAGLFQGIHTPGKPASFDAVLCLGNSLPHLLDRAGLQAALEDFAACLAPGGLVFIQNRNFDQVMQARERWMEPQSHQTADGEWLFLRFYDFLPDGLIDFHVISLQRTAADPWRQEIHTTRLRPLLQAELTLGLQRAGFEEIRLYGDMQAAAFDLQHSPNLIAVARLR